MVVTDQRVLFLWRRWLCGMSLVSMEESFYLDDLQFVCLVRMVRWVWMYVALLCIIVGAVLLAIGDAFKPKTGYASSRYTTSTISYTTGDQNAYATWVAIGVVILMLGVAFLAVFVIKHLGRGVYMSLNFSRKDIGIVDWAGGSWWRPRHSSTKRLIKLKREKAQAAYNLLNAIIHDKFRVKVVRREA
jgi:signal transduction histidine kinase